MVEATATTRASARMAKARGVLVAACVALIVPIRRATVFGVVGLFAAIWLTGPAAAATSKPIPFKGSASGHDASVSFGADGIHITSNATGNGTGLGRFTEVVDYTLSYDLVTFGGSATITAADGSELFLVFQGRIPGFANQVFPLPYMSTFSITGGTGCLAQTTGEGTIDGTDYGQGAFDFTFTGNRSN